MQVKCPCCHEISLWENNPFRPFCSERCKNQDLGDWASERYRIPIMEEEVSSVENTTTKKEEDPSK